MADRCQVSPDLVPPRMVRSYLDKREIAARVHVDDIGPRRFGIPYLRSGASSRELPSIGDAHLPVIVWIVADRSNDRRPCANASNTQREISLVDASCSQLVAKRLEAVLVSRSKHQSRGFSVQSMEDARLPFRVTHVAHFRVTRDETARDVLELTGTERMARNSGRLLEDDIAFGLSDDRDRDTRIRSRMEVPLDGQLRELDAIPGASQLTLLRTNTIHEHSSA